MNDSLYIAATGMHAQQLAVDTIANNLVNLNTSGFKAGRVNFQDLVYRGLAGQSGAERGSGVGVASLAKVFTQGELRKTDNPFELAIQGDGFLEVVLADGSLAYSRGGLLQVNREGFLATADGHALRPALYVGADAREFHIDAQGRVLVTGADGVATEAGQLEMVRFHDPAGLEAAGMNLYRVREQSGDPRRGTPGVDGFGSLAQGYTEGSNVRMTDEMVSLMVAQRAYEMSVKVIQASDEMLGMSNNLRR